MRIGSGTDQKPNLNLDAAKVSATSPIVKPPCKIKTKSAFTSSHSARAFLASFAFIGISSIIFKLTFNPLQIFVSSDKDFPQTSYLSGK